MSNAADLETKYKGKILEAKNLPALPLVLQQAMALMDGSRTNLQKVAAIISRDQVLSAKVLKMVNSPVYGFPGRIASIQNALVLLGFNVIRGVIISTVVFDVMSKSMTGLWEHSVACATVCRDMVGILKLKGVEEFTLGGLLHDFGKVVTAIQLPEARRDIESLVRNEDVLYLEAETLILGFGHNKINSWVGTQWNLPPNLRAAMSYHHNPMAAGSHKTLTSVVHIADFMVRLFEKGFGGDNNVPELDPLSLKHLEIDQKMLGEMLDTIGESLATDINFPTFTK